MSGPFLGVVADDLTGACDLADAVADAGATASVVVGVPAADQAAPATDCLAVALKTRTAPVDQAVAESVDAARWLLDAGAERLYQKYCSTFDSTPEGTIGPVADALLDLLASRTGSATAAGVGTPATPRSGRTQYLGHLFVGDRLLSESPLRDHPLTPMRDADLVRVLTPQTTSAVRLLPWQRLVDGPAAAVRALTELAAGRRTLVLADALRDQDLDVLAGALRSVPGERPLLLSGAAGLAAALARSHAGAPGDRARRGVTRRTRTVPAGSRLILSGSCSAATLAQVEDFAGVHVELDPVALAQDGPAAVDRVLARIADALAREPAGPVLVTSSAAPDRVRDVQRRLGAAASDLLESWTGHVARRAVDSLGVRRLLVAGGETSGAVVRALGVRTLQVGAAAAPGVPWTVSEDGPPLALLLKSGNFGDADLFSTAWSTCP
ncbi:MAG: hypothetical protein BGO38_12605 [Cellulomonas sp. 73-145]|uniref:3-oxo-tetronate kinase n=1 Tax=unclassified Cellulomonas TaxID=2620175 RepID=UPI000926196E|nr:3-oxo-tetronate kinase [Cellulomonas sp. 73-145]OJV59899.1 MAG: hypothetical protein BGO38_12605 [Cellulomonas sp. 73-145]